MRNNTLTKRQVLMALKSALSGSGVVINAETSETKIYEMDDIKEEVLAYIMNEVALLDKKALASKTNKSKTQKENEPIKEQIVNALRLFGRAVTISELIKEGEKMSGYSCQKLSALLSQLVKEGRVVRIEDKKSARFAVD